MRFSVKRFCFYRISFLFAVKFRFLLFMLTTSFFIVLLVFRFCALWSLIINHPSRLSFMQFHFCTHFSSFFLTSSPFLHRPLHLILFTFSSEVLLTCTSWFCIYLTPLWYERSGAPLTLRLVLLLLLRYLSNCEPASLSAPSLSQLPWSRWPAPWPKWSCRITCAMWSLLCSIVMVKPTVSNHQ